MGSNCTLQFQNYEEKKRYKDNYTSHDILLKRKDWGMKKPTTIT
jgi:hypothetical protein